MARFTSETSVGLLSILLTQIGFQNPILREQQSAFEIILFYTLGLLMTGMLYVPPIGGLVIVGKMIRDYGSCTRLS